MKTVLITCFVASNLLSPVGFVLAESPDTDHPPVHEQIERLRQEFEGQRAESSPAASSRYVTQLQELQKDVLAQHRAAEQELDEALKIAREAFAKADHPELRRALVDGTWIWRSDDDHNGVIVSFRNDGTAEHIGMSGKWTVTAPNEVTISTDGDGDYILRVDASLHTFTGDRDNILGTAVQSPIDTLCNNLWSLRDDKLEFQRDGHLIQRGEGWEGKDWRLSDDGTQVTIHFTNGNGGTFKFENGALTHFDGSPFQRLPR